MNSSRSTLVAALMVVELGIVGMAFIAVRGGPVSPWMPPAMAGAEAAARSGNDLVEGGAPRSFVAIVRPALTVDIGYADLTIQTGDPGRIEASVSKSTDFGPFRATAPISARAEGETVHITTTQEHGWSIGDNRMVTVTVPPETLVTVINAGDIRASGLRAPAVINSVGTGHITVEDFAAPSLHVAASDGRISLFRITASHIDVTSDDGRIEGTDLNVRDGSIESSDGRVTLAFAPGSDTLVTAEASDGHIRVSGVDPAAAGQAHASSDDDDDSSSRTVRFGAGSGRLDVRASDGNIDISQS